jgi:hypothetical protein
MARKRKDLPVPGEVQEATRERMTPMDEVLDEALELSRRGGAALPAPISEDDEEDNEEDSNYEYDSDYEIPEAPPYEDGDDDDPDIAELNNPDVTALGQPPQIGGGTQSSEMFGVPAHSAGRVSSPKLFSQAAGFPTAIQFRVWRWENGVPVGLGSIDAEATEDDFIQHFYNAMPQAGDGKFQFKLRPIDIRGKEMGKELTITISEHHAEVLRQRKIREREEKKESRMDPLIIGQGGGGEAAFAEEMGRMYEAATEASERRTEELQRMLEMERERLREEEKARYQERASLADRSTQVVQTMTEKLMSSDRSRAEEQIQGQREQSQLLLSTITTVFQQQQEAARQQSDRVREGDERRMGQDREFFERQRQDMELRRKAEQEEADRKRVAEQDNAERKRRSEAEDWERRRRVDQEEARMRQDGERARLELEAKRMEEQRVVETERLRQEAERRREEAREERERWRQEAETRRAEADQKRQQEREEWDRRALQDRERLERERQEFQLRLERERQDLERKQQAQREDADRKERQIREELERKETLRREEAEREAARRRDEVELSRKQMDVSAQRDREHAERMLEMARLEREGQREAQERREKSEREAREQSERDRNRQHEMTLREMEMNRERDREHAERMLQLSKIQTQGGSLLGSLGETLGMEAPEILGRIFGSGGEGEGGGGGWSDAVPKVLGSIAEVARVAMASKAQQAQVSGRGQRALTVSPTLIPSGPMPHTADPGALSAQGAHLPDGSSIPSEFADLDTEPTQERPASQAPKPETTKRAVDLIKRAKKGGVSLRDQKKARKAIRILLDTLEGTPEEEWVGAATDALTDEIQVYHYIKAVGIAVALSEARPGDEEFTQKILQALRDSEMIPDEVPFTEADYQRLQKGQ